MNIMLNETAYMPTRAHAVDAGIDLYAPIRETDCQKEYPLMSMMRGTVSEVKR